jgi:hypothetical protein
MRFPAHAFIFYNKVCKCPAEKEISGSGPVVAGFIIRHVLIEGFVIVSSAIFFFSSRRSTFWCNTKSVKPAFL